MFTFLSFEAFPYKIVVDFIFCKRLPTENCLSYRWNPDAIVFNSAQVYGTPSYWMQQFFIQSNGASLLNSTLQASSVTSVIASAIIWKNPDDSKYYLRLKVL